MFIGLSIFKRFIWWLNNVTLYGVNDCGHLTITLTGACWTSFFKTMGIRVELPLSYY